MDLCQTYWKTTYHIHRTFLFLFPTCEFIFYDHFGFRQHETLWERNFQGATFPTVCSNANHREHWLWLFRRVAENHNGTLKGLVIVAILKCYPYYSFHPISAKPAYYGGIQAITLCW